ncbi:hypothetical protein QLX08_010307 [Tetragonisca angustula]|uniref:Uncharacterized protein n=1 Tax=Tetragonisca angustula TaxID=166442 RepID=A0AAW0ZCK2_9HYME
MFVKFVSAVVCISCFSYTFYILCNLTYFLSSHNENKGVITVPERGK